MTENGINEKLDINNDIESRRKSNEAVDEALRRKGMIIFTFEKNAHRIDLSKKEYEEVEVCVRNDKKGEYKFKLSDMSENTGDFSKLVKDFNEFEGITEIEYRNIFRFEKFTGEDLLDKEMVDNIEREVYTTAEKLVSIYYKTMN